jgi:hypothetical protein
MKQGSMDLVTINYRFQGLAGKICKTQKQSSQIDQSLGLDLKKTTGGTRLKRCNRSKGLSADSTRHRKTAGISSFSGG